MRAPALRRLAAATGKLASLLALAALPVAAVAAPSIDDANLVLSRERPGLDPEGLQLGGFRVLPAVDAGLAYDDNLYSTPDEGVRTAIYTLTPRVAARSTWSRHAINLDASGTFERYSKRKSENNDQYRINGSGRLDISGDTHADFNGRIIQAIEQRGTAGDVFGEGEPIQYRTRGGDAGITTRLGRIELSGLGRFDRFTYGSARIDGIDLSQSYRDRNSFGGQGMISYAISPSVEPFVQLSYGKERYDSRARLTSLDSKTWIMLGGVNFEVTRLIFGRVGLGYQKRTYRNPTFANSSGFTYDASIVWNPRTLLSLTFQARKAIDESPNLLASGIIRNEVNLGADYELLRNVLLQARGSYSTENYRGLERKDKRLGAGVGMRYLMNRFAEIGLQYDHRRQRGAGLFGRDYDGNALRLTVTLQR